MVNAVSGVGEGLRAVEVGVCSVWFGGEVSSGRHMVLMGGHGSAAGCSRRTGALHSCCMFLLVGTAIIREEKDIS